MLLIENHR